jgi:peroxiredoxin
MAGNRVTPVLIVMALAAAPAQAAETPGLGLAFELPAANGKRVEFPDDHGGITVVCFLGAECPLARLYGPRLQQLADEFETQGVWFVGINSNRQDSMSDVEDYVAEHEITFPVAKDYDNHVADQFGAHRTPEVFVIDEDLTVRYRGRIDDQYLPGIVRSEPSREDLRVALEELLSGEPVSVPSAEATGCRIGRVHAGEVTCQETWCREVTRILQAHCVECHRAGEIGPFALTDYEEVLGWAETMLETIDDGRMPPWHADPDHGDFTNARLMTDSDKETLHNWVSGGMPYGDIGDLPEPEDYVDGWQLDGEPDLVVSMREEPFGVPARGIVEYQYFVVDPGFEEDTWVSGAQVVPGNRSVVHHAIVFIRPPDGARFRGMGWLGAYVPGQRSTMLPQGYARRVPAGSKLVFQMHYTPNGAEQDDCTRIGLIFEEDESVTHEVFTLVALDQDFEIPPHAGDFAVEGRLSRLPAEAELLAIAPHMHLRGKSFEVFACSGERRDILLNVPHYDFNWQHVYELSEPLPLGPVERLEFTIRFDNSDANPFNPDPSQYVTWGDQTWEEMAVAFFGVAHPRSAGGLHRRDEPEDPAVEAARQEKIADYVEQFFDRFDENGDGTVVEPEMPLSVQRFGFRRFDGDRDGRVTREEVEAAAGREF